MTTNETMIKSMYFSTANCSATKFFKNRAIIEQLQDLFRLRIILLNGSRN